MSTYILSSLFANGFNDEVARHLQKLIKNKKRFAFIPSEFEREHEKTDTYFQYFLRCFADIGILFEYAYIIDGRMEKEDIRKRVKEADVIWLSGKYLIYGLCDNSIIIVTDNNIEFIGEAYRIQFGSIQRV